MSTKRTSTESSLESNRIDHISNDCSDSVFQGESNAKRAKLASVTELQDLPNELLEDILIRAVVMEVSDSKLAKRAWKEKADLVMSRLETVSWQWSNILTTNYFRNKVHGILEGTAQKAIRLELLQLSSVKIFALNVAVMKDELFVLWNGDFRGYSINVYDLSNMDKVKDVIWLPGGRPIGLVASSVSNCVYLLSEEQLLSQVSVLRIWRGDDRQFNVSEIICDLWLPNPSLSVTTTGELILSMQHDENRVVVSVYSADGALQQKMRLSSKNSSLVQIIPKANGNLVLVSLEKDQSYRKLTEIDLRGTIQRRSLSSVIGDMNVSHADIHGRMLLTEPSSNKVLLLDSEFNLLDLDGTRLDVYHPLPPHLTYYNGERKEIMRFSNDGALSILGLMDE